MEEMQKLPTLQLFGTYTKLSSAETECREIGNGITSLTGRLIRIV